MIFNSIKYFLTRIPTPFCSNISFISLDSFPFSKFLEGWALSIFIHSYNKKFLICGL